MSEILPTNRASATGEGPQVDVQDPLPETDWFWRRTFTFVLSISCVVGVWYGIEALWELRAVREVFQITRYILMILALLIFFYMIAPSAEQITKLVQTAKTLRTGVPMTRTARVTTPEGQTEVSTTAGTPAPPETLPAPSTVAEEDIAPRSRT